MNGKTNQLPLFGGKSPFDHPDFAEVQPNVLQKFKEFHATHENLLEIFVRFSRQAKVSGHRHYGIGAITERVRWHLDVEATRTEGEEFKINNNLRSCYARLIMILYPDLKGMFETRTHKNGMWEDLSGESS